MSSEWREVKFSELCDITRGGSPRPIQDYLSDAGMPWVKIADATKSDSRFIDNTNECIKLEGVRKSVKVHPGDLILSNSATPGLPKFMNIEACIHDGWMLLRNFRGLNKRFAYWLLLNERKRLVMQGNGSVFTNLKTDILKNHVVRIPSELKQEEIADILDSISDKIDLNRQTNQTLEQIAQAVFKSWFVHFDPVRAKIAAREAFIQQHPKVTEEAIKAAAGTEGDTLAHAGAKACEIAAICAISGKTEEQLNELNVEALQQLKATAALFPEALVDSELGEIPEGWKYQTFGDVSHCFDSKRVPLSKKQRETKKPGNIPYYGATSIMDYINEWLFDDTYLLLGEDGSVLKEDGTPFVQYIWGKSWINNHAHVLQGSNGVSTEQLMLLMQQTNITAYVTGAVQLKLNQKNMNSIPFLNAGSVLNRVFYEKVISLYESVRKTIEENGVLEELRDTILPRLLSGDLDLTSFPRSRVGMHTDRTNGQKSL